jgi:hypothetical protein
MCRSFYDRIVLADLVYNSISVVIAVINTIYKYLVKFLVTKIGFMHKTDEVKVITIMIFLSQFINTAIILLIVSYLDLRDPTLN